MRTRVHGSLLGRYPVDDLIITALKTVTCDAITTLPTVSHNRGRLTLLSG